MPRGGPLPTRRSARGGRRLPRVAVRARCAGGVAAARRQARPVSPRGGGRPVWEALAVASVGGGRPAGAPTPVSAAAASLVERPRRCGPCGCVDRQPAVPAPAAEAVRRVQGGGRRRVGVRGGRLGRRPPLDVCGVARRAARRGRRRRRRRDDGGGWPTCRGGPHAHWCCRPPACRRCRPPSRRRVRPVRRTFVATGQVARSGGGGCPHAASGRFRARSGKLLGYGARGLAVHP